MHQPVSLRPDGGICQFMPIRTRPEKWSINNKTINGVLKRPSNVSNKKEIMPAVFGQTFLFVNPISWHFRWQKTAFLRLIIEFFFFWGVGGILMKIYRNIFCVKSCLSFNCWTYFASSQANNSDNWRSEQQNSLSLQTLGDITTDQKS